jgi:hypothetical protein
MMLKHRKIWKNMEACGRISWERIFKSKLKSAMGEK